MRNKTSSRLNSCLLIDSTAMTPLPGPRNPEECHLYVAEGCHLYIAATQGLLPPPATPASPLDLWPVIGAFRLWMPQHRGLTETTLDVYQPIIAELLTALGGNTHLYAAEALRQRGA